MQMTRRAWLSSVSLAGVGAALAGCGTTPAGPAAPVIRGVTAVEPAADPRPFGAADTAFGLDVLRAWGTRHPGQNLVFSPSTLASSLGLAYLGARGATAASLARVLHLPPGTMAEREAGLRARAAALGALNGPGVTVSASQRVWADPGLPPRASYLDAVATGYNAGVSRVPFTASPDRAASAINQAIAADTHDHITQLVTADMLDNVGWVLTSALYLDAQWALPFDADETAPGPFTRADGTSVSVQYLHGGPFGVAVRGGRTAVALPYRGGKLSMTALLPPAGAGGGVRPSPDGLAALDRDLARARSGSLAVVDLPKIALSTAGPTGNMTPVLSALGMGAAFGGGADFTGLSAKAGPLAFVQQAATLQVAEKGTVGAAAAATGAIATARIGGLPVRFDRPYLLLVSARATSEPLFLAAVADPAAG
jgi:serpin B